MNLDKLRKELDDIRDSFRKLQFILTRFADILSKTFNYDELLEGIFSLISEFIEYRGAYFFSNTPEKRFVFYKANIKESEKDFTKVLQENIEEGVLDWIIGSNRGASILPYNFILPENEIEEEGVFLVVPLIAQNNYIGILFFDSLLQEQEISNEYMLLLKVIAVETAVALNNALLYEEMEKKNEELARIQKNLENIYESLNNGMVIIDLEGKIKRLNSRAVELLEILFIEGGDIPYEEILPRPLKKKIKKLFKETIEYGRAMDFTLENLYINSSGIPLGFSGNRLLDENNELAGVILLIHDVSESIELNELRKIDKMKDELISNISHELRTPLTSIKAYTETLKELLSDEGKISKEEGDEFLNIIFEESERLGNLINDLLDLSRLESGKDIKLKRKKFSVGRLLKKVKKLLNKLAEEKQITINLECPSNLSCWGDSERLEQVMINLVSNAIKYNKIGGKIEVTAQGKGNKIIFKVKDTGYGIPEKDLPFIFDKFYRVDSSLTYEESGTGIGLAIVKSIVEAHGGEIKVKSREGEGAEFEFYIPQRGKEE